MLFHSSVLQEMQHQTIAIQPSSLLSQVHVMVLVLEGRLQAELLHGLRALGHYLMWAPGMLKKLWCDIALGKLSSYIPMREVRTCTRAVPSVWWRHAFSKCEGKIIVISNCRELVVWLLVTGLLHFDRGKDIVSCTTLVLLSALKYAQYETDIWNFFLLKSADTESVYWISLFYSILLLLLLLFFEIVYW